MSRVKYYDTEKYGKISVSKLVRELGVGYKQFYEWEKYRDGDINAVVEYALNVKPGTKEGYCLTCGKKTLKPDYCGYKCRKLAYLDMQAKGTLPPGMLQTKSCLCGCGRTFQVIKTHKNRQYFGPECRYMYLKESRAPKHSLGVQKTWAKKFERPEPCGTCANYRGCCDYMALNGLDRGWPCEQKQSFADYKKEVIVRKYSLHAINPTCTGGYHS